MISIVCPVYEMQGRGVEMLGELLASIYRQTFTDYEIVISSDPGAENMDAALQLDPAINLPKIVTVWGKQGAAANLNNAINHASGDIIKPMFQDDKFMHPDSLQKIADAFQPSTSIYVNRTESDFSYESFPQWVACTSYNSGIENWEHIPRPHVTLARLREGENTYGSPSAMAWRRNGLRMDENLKWLFDCEFYSRMAQRYGVPTFVDTPIFIRQWEGQATRAICEGHQRVLDTNAVIEKYRGAA